MTIRAITTTVALTMMFAAQAQAEGAFRMGIGAGQATITADEVDLEGKATAWEVFVGYEANENWAVEAGYVDGGTADDSLEGATVEADTSAFVASVIGSLSVSDGFSIYARGGIMHWESDETLKIGGQIVASENLDGNDPFFGVGGAAVVDTALVRLEYRLANLDDTDLSLISLAIVWRF
jgi:OmpA-OmpF porin, OOP family